LKQTLKQNKGLDSLRSTNFAINVIADRMSRLPFPRCKNWEICEKYWKTWKLFIVSSL